MAAPSAGEGRFDALLAFCAADGDRSGTLTLPSGQRIVVGRGARSRLPELLAALGPGPVGIVAGRSQAGAGRLQELSERLPEPARAFVDVRPHAERALYDRAAAELAGSGVVVALGGGSALGVGKAVACRLEVPLVAVPTTYAGSELTMLYGETYEGRKHVLRDPRALPATVVYDAELTDGLPPSEGQASLFNCLAHCVEAAWGPEGAVVGPVALEGARLLAVGAADPVSGSEQWQLAALCGGVALAEGGTGVHHAICHAVGGHTRASHGEINAIVLPAAVAAVDGDAAAAAAPLVAPLRPLVGGGAVGEDDASVLRALRERWGLPSRLRELGVTAADVPVLADQVLTEAQGKAWVAGWDAPRLTALIEEIT